MAILAFHPDSLLMLQARAPSQPDDPVEQLPAYPHEFVTAEQIMGEMAKAREQFHRDMAVFTDAEVSSTGIPVIPITPNAQNASEQMTPASGS